MSALYIAKSPLGGRGVFTEAPIKKGSLIESCPVIVLPAEDVPRIHATRLHDYYFIWGEEEDLAAIALGYGSLYNHDYHPNAEYEPDFESDQLHFFALRDIHTGEEIKVNYNGDPRVKDELWFR